MSSTSGLANNIVIVMAGSGGKSTGTYTIGDYAIELTDDSGKTQTAFFFRDAYTKSDGTTADSIQIDETWYSRSEPE